MDMEFYQWLINERGLLEYSAKRYYRVIYKKIYEWLPSYDIPKNSIEFEAMKQMIFAMPRYKEINKTGNNMYSSALNHYGQYLKEFDLNDLDIFSEKQSFTTEAERLIKVRLVQNKFRKRLFDVQPCCAISGFNYSPFLIASHIKPWSISNEQERLDQYNGLLLTPNYDRLFDRGLITIKHSGEILVSKVLGFEEQNFFKIPKKIAVSLKPEYKSYLEFHADNIFEN